MRTEYLKANKFFRVVFILKLDQVHLHIRKQKVETCEGFFRVGVESDK